MTFALDEDLAGFNVNTSAASEFVLQEILDVVWPQVFIINTAANAGSQHSVDHERCPDKHQPPDDRLHDQPQGGLARRYTDRRRRLRLQLRRPERQRRVQGLGGKAFDDATTVGYNQMKSVTASNPPNGAACTTSPSSATLPAVTCGNGDTVTVVLREALRRLEVALQRPCPRAHSHKVGWSTGFTDYTTPSRAAGTRSRATRRTRRSCSRGTRSTGEPLAS